MSNISELQQFDLKTFAAGIKNYQPLANRAFFKASPGCTNAPYKMSIKERIDYLFCDILDTPRFYYEKAYRQLNPQNRMLTNGIFFKSLFDEYLAHLNINFDDIRLQTKTAYTIYPMISKQEYDTMPKRYRGIFMPYDSQHYVLHSNLIQPHATVIFVKQDKKKELKELLESARILLPVIYKTQFRKHIPQLTQEEYNKRWLNRTVASVCVEPAFVPQESISGQHISDQQIDALQRLCDIFTRIDDMTMSYKRDINSKIRSNAFRIYEEHQNELTQKNRYLDAQNAINRARKETTGLQELSTRAPKTEHAGIDVLLEQAQKNYADARQRIIAAIPGRTK